MGRSKHTFDADDATLVDTSSTYQTSMAQSSALQHTIPPNQSSPARLYHIYNSLWRHDYNVSTGDKAPLYHVNNSSLTPKKPDLTIHAGTSISAPVVAVCKFLHFSRHFKVGLGDPQSPNSVTWEDLVCLSFVHVRYRFQMTVDTGNGIERRPFVWKHTYSVGVGDTKPSLLTWRNFKLVDEATDQLIAVFTSNSWGYKKSGKLELHANFGQEFDLMVIITGLALYERQRRQRASSSGGGGGGGG
ncbi:uncharacterized protein ACLA_065570 [Aspergillus clavatus NRRL 1]|uniref:Uncharacterized protein n=1 Tax=Aspergillus clavatus (strain ATCC 1007 / CBS 513.65 / DSM 816 / NCTC 3887 / NRRL 1 / QM 1276 / 107) TaxID=344612 RepID=A1CG43_ASPCL|nr:uncharacterized protein ACLA_065570 [Aspergillus clavatus NRRL 1]EAW10923.1 conserved hypothetical protein [Aspergillus clavatus NRRL 1]